MTRFDIQKDPSVYWTVKEVADYLRMSEDAIYNLTRKGALEAIHVGRSIRIRGSAIMNYEQSQMGSCIRP